MTDETQLTLEDADLKANYEEARDTEYQEVLLAWDVTLADGLAL